MVTGCVRSQTRAVPSRGDRMGDRELVRQKMCWVVRRHHTGVQEWRVESGTWAWDEKGVVERDERAWATVGEHVGETARAVQRCSLVRKPAAHGGLHEECTHSTPEYGPLIAPCGKQTRVTPGKYGVTVSHKRVEWRLASACSASLLSHPSLTVSVLLGPSFINLTGLDPRLRAHCASLSSLSVSDGAQCPRRVSCLRPLPNFPTHSGLLDTEGHTYSAPAK